MAAAYFDALMKPEVKWSRDLTANVKNGRIYTSGRAAGSFTLGVMAVAVDKRETFTNDSKWIVQYLTDSLNDFNCI